MGFSKPGLFCFQVWEIMDISGHFIPIPGIPGQELMGWERLCTRSEDLSEHGKIENIFLWHHFGGDIPRAGSSSHLFFPGLVIFPWIPSVSGVLEC